MVIAVPTVRVVVDVSLALTKVVPPSVADRVGAVIPEPPEITVARSRFASTVVALVFESKVYSTIVAAERLADAIRPTTTVAKTPVRID